MSAPGIPAVNPASTQAAPDTTKEQEIRSSGPRDTGFQEPLNPDRNTMLPHPDRSENSDSMSITEKISKRKRVPHPHRRHQKKHGGSGTAAMDSDELDPAVDDPSAGLVEVGDQSVEDEKAGGKGKVKNVLKKMACQE